MLTLTSQLGKNAPIIHILNCLVLGTTNCHNCILFLNYVDWCGCCVKKYAPRSKTLKQKWSWDNSLKVSGTVHFPIQSSHRAMPLLPPKININFN